MQPGEPTIQGELQAALGRVTGESPLPQGSGRTDAGVHALAQVASFALQAPIPAAESAPRPQPDPAPLHSDSRSEHRAKHLSCTTLGNRQDLRVPGSVGEAGRSEICPPFLARYVYACPWPLDLGSAPEAAANFFLGEHDFLSFAATDPDLTNRIESSNWRSKTE